VLAFLLRRALLALLVLGPLVVALDWLGAASKLTIFLLAAGALIPLAWLIGEATDNAAYGLTDVVRASLVGSIVGNLLLVLGFTLLVGQQGTIDRRSAATSLGLIAFVILVLLIPAAPGLHGDPDRRALAELSLPVAVALLIVRLLVNRRALRRQRALQRAAEPAGSRAGRSASRWRCSALRP
jgi:Ca2+:H+ antiporter